MVTRIYLPVDARMSTLFQKSESNNEIEDDSLELTLNDSSVGVEHSSPTQKVLSKSQKVLSTFENLPGKKRIPEKSGFLNANNIKVVVRVRPTIPEDVKIEQQQQQALLNLTRGRVPVPTLSTILEPTLCVNIDKKQDNSISTNSENDNEKENRRDTTTTTTTTTNESQCDALDIVSLRKQFYDDKTFSVNCAANMDCSQAAFYDEVAKPIVDSVLTGINGTILCYGQTGAGKTYSSFGGKKFWHCEKSQKLEKDNDPIACNIIEKVLQSRNPRDLSQEDGMYWDCAGLIPRAVVQIFREIEKEHAPLSKISLSMLQLYQNKAKDLLSSKSVDDIKNVNQKDKKAKRFLLIRENPQSGVFVEGLSKVVVKGARHLISLLHTGANRRITKRTCQNRRSSRSHCIIQISVERCVPVCISENDFEKIDSQHVKVHVKHGTLTIVDLAGSERVSISRSTGMRLRETCVINKSISALGNCVAALASASSSSSKIHIPFRDSKLTRLLSSSLRGNSKTCICANISPCLANYDETHSTLLFAKRAMHVRTKPIANIALTSIPLPLHEESDSENEISETELSNFLPCRKKNIDGKKSICSDETSISITDLDVTTDDKLQNQSFVFEESLIQTKRSKESENSSSITVPTLRLRLFAARLAWKYITAQMVKNETERNEISILKKRDIEYCKTFTKMKSEIESQKRLIQKLRIRLQKIQSAVLENIT
eukprot:g2755.t1